MAEDHHWIQSGAKRLSAILHSADADRIIVLAHGFTGHKIEAGRLFVQAARTFAEGGFSVLRFDFAGSGDSEGSFDEMSPKTEIADLHAVLEWVRDMGFSRRGLLGLSMGGAVSTFVAAERQDLKALVLWSPVPGFMPWAGMGFPTSAWEGALRGETFNRGEYPLGPKFFTDMLELDVPKALSGVTIPKLIVEGDNDAPGFQTGNFLNLRNAPEPKEMRIIRGGDHVFTNADNRREVIAVSMDFFRRYV
ncbi:MAG TPA: alpha/beta fold hydrolase [Candidatus Brocadiia bacterium]|nr:alpha/beta fold hydrolase [Candidatus Brocadiia bacterium]